jgi:fatty-acyl-CoA synthase
MLVISQEVDLARVRTHLRNHLPEYAPPLSLRIRNELQMTATFNYTDNSLLHPVVADDVIYFNDRQRAAFVRL